LTTGFKTTKILQTSIKLKMAKVVYNNCVGQFGLSQQALEKMVELGSKYVKENPNYGTSYGEPDEISPKKWWEAKYIFDWDCPRHDEILVKVVSELGYFANGPKSSLELADVVSKYIIMSTNGMEQVIQPQDIQWQVASNRL